jgi:hypothetical protein
MKKCMDYVTKKTDWFLVGMLVAFAYCVVTLTLAFHNVYQQLQ